MLLNKAYAQTSVMVVLSNTMYRLSVLKCLKGCGKIGGLEQGPGRQDYHSATICLFQHCSYQMRSSLSQHFIAKCLRYLVRVIFGLCNSYHVIMNAYSNHMVAMVL